MAKTTLFTGTLELYSYGGEEFLYIPSITSRDLLSYLQSYVINTYLDTDNYDFYLNNEFVLNGEIINEASIEIISDNIEIYTFFSERTGEDYPYFVGDDIQAGSTITFEVEDKVQKKVNKVVYNNTTLIDITDTTAVESDVAEGKEFYKADGQKAVGTNAGGLDETLLASNSATEIANPPINMALAEDPLLFKYIKIIDEYENIHIIDTSDANFTYGGASVKIGVIIGNFYASDMGLTQGFIRKIKKGVYADKAINISACYQINGTTSSVTNRCIPRRVYGLGRKS